MSGPSPWLPQEYRLKRGRFQLSNPEHPTIREIQRLSPIVRFHPDDEYMPMDPVDFIKMSRFRHHRALWFDQGYDKIDQRWKTNNSHSARYYDIPIDFINSYGLHSNGKNRRPRDNNRGSSWNVFLEPRVNPRGVAAPDGVIPTFYIVMFDPPLREHGDEVLHIQYWWFFGYNVATWPSRHQGDWEHATAVLKKGTFLGAFMAQHETSEFYSFENLDYEGGHWVVYSAQGTHASYHKVGTFSYTFGSDNTSAAGSRMRTWRKLHILKDQPWKDYAGAWGEVGSFSFTTGPLGPWHKRFTKL